MSRGDHYQKATTRATGNRARTTAKASKASGVALEWPIVVILIPGPIGGEGGDIIGGEGGEQIGEES